MKKRFRAVELKYLDEETVRNVRVWRNQPFVREKMYNQHEITEEEHGRFIENLKKDDNKGLFVFYFDEEPFAVYQYEIHPNSNYVTNGIYLTREEYADMGYGTIMDYFVSEINFKILKVNKSFGEVIDINERAKKLNKRMGAQLEGILREHVMINGIYHDIYLYGMLKSDWNNKSHKIKNLVHEFVIEEEITQQIRF